MLIMFVFPIAFQKFGISLCQLPNAKLFDDSKTEVDHEVFEEVIGANTGVYELSIDGVSEGLYCLITVMLLCFFQADRDAIELFFHVDNWQWGYRIILCINNVNHLNRTWVEQMTQPVCPRVLFLFGLFLGDLGGALLPVWMKMVLKLYVKYCCAGFVSELPAVGHSTPALSQEDSKTDSTVILSDESPQGKRSRPNRSDAHAVSIFFVAHWLQIIQPCPGPLSHLSQNTNVTRESSQMKDNSWPVAMEIHNSACSLQSYICPTQ